MKGGRYVVSNRSLLTTIYDVPVDGTPIDLNGILGAYSSQLDVMFSVLSMVGADLVEIPLVASAEGISTLPLKSIPTGQIAGFVTVQNASTSAAVQPVNSAGGLRFENPQTDIATITLTCQCTTTYLSAVLTAGSVIVDTSYMLDFPTIPAGTSDGRQIVPNGSGFSTYGLYVWNMMTYFDEVAQSNVAYNRSLLGQYTLPQDGSPIDISAAIQQVTSSVDVMLSVLFDNYGGTPHEIILNCGDNESRIQIQANEQYAPKLVYLANETGVEILPIDTCFGQRINDPQFVNLTLLPYPIEYDRYSLDRPSPGNDSIGNREIIDQFEVESTWSRDVQLQYAGTDPYEPVTIPASGVSVIKTVWFEFTPDRTMVCPMTLSVTNGSGPTFAVFTGTPDYNGLSIVYGMSDGYGVFTFQANTTYYIQVGISATNINAGNLLTYVEMREYVDVNTTPTPTPEVTPTPIPGGYTSTSIYTDTVGDYKFHYTDSDGNIVSENGTRFPDVDVLVVDHACILNDSLVIEIGRAETFGPCTSGGGSSLLTSNAVDWLTIPNYTSDSRRLQPYGDINSGVVPTWLYVWEVQGDYNAETKIMSVYDKQLLGEFGIPFDYSPIDISAAVQRAMATTDACIIVTVYADVNSSFTEILLDTSDSPNRFTAISIPNYGEPWLISLIDDAQSTSIPIDSCLGTIVPNPQTDTVTIALSAVNYDTFAMNHPSQPAP